MMTFTLIAVLVVVFTWIAGWSDVANLFRRTEQDRIDEIFFEMVEKLDIEQ